MKPGGNFNSSQWDFNKVEKSKLTPEQINYAVEQYFWRTKDPEMKKQFELWSNYQQNTNASQKADPISDIAAASELPEVTITMAKPNYIDQIKSDIRNKWTNMSTEDKVHAGIDAATTIGGFIPGVDIVADGVDLLHSLQRKDWAGAGIGAAAMALPVVSAPMLKKLKNSIDPILHPKKTKKAKALAEELNKVIDESTINQMAPITPESHIAPIPRTEHPISNKELQQLYQRPKKNITDDEFAGLPKGERNQPKRQWLPGEITYNADGQPKLYYGGGWRNPFKPTKPLPEPFAKAVNREPLGVLDSNNRPGYYAPRRKQALLKAYGKGEKPDANLKATLDNIISDRDTKSLGMISKEIGRSDRAQIYVDMFRDYYRHLGIDLDDYTDIDLAKVLDNQYDYLTSMQRGKVRGLLYWHASPNWFDTFDPAKRGSSHRDHHDDFAGSYFAQHPLYYGANLDATREALRKQGINPDRFTNQELGVLGGANTQPYLFDRVRHVLEPTEHFKDIELSEGMLGFGHNLTPSIVSGDEPTIVSQRIASLFPHPETANGQWFIRSFDDPRVNFKQGGKLNYLNLMNNGYRK